MALLTGIAIGVAVSAGVYLAANGKKLLRKRRMSKAIDKALKEARESGALVGCQHTESLPEQPPQGYVSRISVAFPEWVEMTGDDQRAILDVVKGMCERYENAHPDRVMWPLGIGGRPINIWDDAEFDVDMSVFDIEVGERERYDTDTPKDAQ